MSFVLRSSMLAHCLKVQHNVTMFNPAAATTITSSSTSARKSLLDLVVRQFGNNANRGSGRGSGAGRVYTRQTISVEKPARRSLKEILLQPTSGAPFALGSSAVAGASLVGLGALCYYGLGMSKNATYENSYAWPSYVRDRIKSTYFYFGSGLGITAASAVAAFRSPVMMRLMSRNSFGAILLTIGAMIGTSIVAQSIPYNEGTLGLKQVAWAVHCGVLGAVIAPMCILGGPLLLRAALYTAGISGGLSAIAYCAPNDKFLYIGGPLAIGLGVVFAASLGSMFLAPTTALGASLYSISLYGGLILFSAFLLYDTQRIVRKAETHPYYAAVPYDPVNASMSIYMDVINIFVRMLAILSGSGNRRR